MKNLIIVESPAKAKTIEKYLGGEYKVIASKGHIIDLPKSSLGVDVNNGFLPEYIIMPGKEKVINSIKKEVPEKGTVYLAPDPDREGEAIAWHIARSIGLINNAGESKKVRGKDVSLKRIVFHEITKDAIVDSFKHSRGINMHLVDAQQARRVLDRLVGYKLSPLLWTKIRYGLSAGRVQSVAVRFIVERERERDAFVSVEYWSIEGVFGHTNGEVKAGLHKIENKKVEIKDKESTDKILEDLRKRTFCVKDVVSKDIKRHPSPPFITSTLQQEASRKLGFSAKYTMSLAQKLYEGVQTAKGNVALITYMRTDSYNLSLQSINSMKDYINKNYGKEYLPAIPAVYRKKSKLAQEAHEAIRPVDIFKIPSLMSKDLSKDELKLYDLIWKRTLASQMSEAVLTALIIDIIDNAGIYIFRANGQKLKFPGFIKLYYESKDEEAESNDFIDNILPVVNKGDAVDLKELIPLQHFTQPPARYSEATLVKVLEENGIGRPSTYAPIMSTIIDRGYVEKEGKYFKPKDVGYVVNDLLVKHFGDIVDVGFTSEIEKDLDEIANGAKEYKKILSSFYSSFEKNLENKNKEIKKEDVVVLGESDEKCPECEGKMVIKLGKYGKFLSCSSFPDCKGMKSLDEEMNEKTDEVCEKCNSSMVIKMNKKGLKFLGCSKYPECDFTKSIPTGLICESCGADLVQRKSKWGKLFYGCSKYPECKFILNPKGKKKEVSQDDTNIRTENIQSS